MRKWEPVQRGYCWPDQSHHQSNCSVIFVCLFRLLFLPDFCWRKRFCWRVKALGHSILVTKAKGTFVQVWARNVFTYFVLLVFVCHRTVLRLCLFITGMSRMLVIKLVLAYACRLEDFLGFPLFLKTNYFKFQPRSKMVDKELLFRESALRNTINGLINAWGVY